MFDLTNFTKYLVEALAVAAVAYFMYQDRLNPQEILKFAATVGVVFFVLDTFAPQVASGARFGTGFGLGEKLGSLISQ